MKSATRFYAVIIALLVLAGAVHVADWLLGPAIPSLLLMATTIAVVMRLLRR
jgi:hypothetical protein